MSAKDRWFLPTNTNNMRMIIAQGLVTGPDGFKKYYVDALGLLPGWIPIYKKIQPDVLKKGISERENLTPCIIEFDLKAVKGVAKTIKNDELIDIEIENVGNSEIDVLYILAPLPLSCVLKIIFKNDKDKKQFEDDAQNRSNVILSGLKLVSTKADRKLFKNEGSKDEEMFKAEKSQFYSRLKEKFNFSENTTGVNINYNKVYAFGGLLSTMFYFAKNGNNSNDIYHSINEFENLPESKINDIHLIYNFFLEQEADTEPNLKKRMYKGLINIALNSTSFKEDLIEYLESDSWDQDAGERTRSIADKLRSFETNNNKAVSEHFKEAKTSLEKILLMLFLREDSEALMDYNLDLFSEEDYMQFAMIFGIRDKFSKIPGFLRAFNGLQNYVSNQMAEYAHKQSNIKMQFEYRNAPLTLMDMLKNSEFKKWFAKQLKIESCITTKVIIPKGDYTTKVSNSGVEFLINGLVKTPVPEFKDKEYFDFISKWKFTEYGKYVTKYNKVK